MLAATFRADAAREGWVITDADTVVLWWCWGWAIPLSLGTVALRERLSTGGFRRPCTGAGQPVSESAPGRRTAGAGPVSRNRSVGGLLALAALLG
ncbi:hypothetical protein GCM10028793_36170 [Nocardiopsis oceani]